MAKFSNKDYAAAHKINDALIAETADLTLNMATDMVLDDNPFRGAPLLDTDFSEEPVETDFTIAEENAIEALDTDMAIETDAVVEVQAPEASEIQASTAQDFDARCAAITDTDAIEMAIEIGKQIDIRADFERSTGNETIQKHLEKSRKQLATPRAARVVLACYFSRPPRCRQRPPVDCHCCRC